MLTRIPNNPEDNSSPFARRRTSPEVPNNSLRKRNDGLKPTSYPINVGKKPLFPKPIKPAGTQRPQADSWQTVPFHLPADIETALLDKQVKRQPETPNEKALHSIGKELRAERYPVILKLPRGTKPSLYVGEKLEVTLKWEIESYIPEEQPESYGETEYYLDEACLEIWVCGVCVESTLCYANFLSKLRELKTLNPKLF
jgi:hypothetical protein